MSIDPSRSVAELVLEHPPRSRVLEEAGLDYCCGGKRSLSDACAGRGLDVDDLVARLEAAADDGSVEATDWRAVPTGELCDHIVEVHHGMLRRELPRLSALLEKCERAHGQERPELQVMRLAFERLRGELEHHMQDEEERLFPHCRGGSRLKPDFVGRLEDDHAAAGAALEELRALSGGYDLDRVLCNTHRATVAGLRELELDLHRHIHEENNILFPRVVAAA